jgi:RNA-binding protein 26
VEKIPEDKLSLDQVNEWFKRFGTVTNVATDAVGGKALVSFEKHDEARAAWRSEEAVFGNRFVKVFWHKPMEGHGQVGARMLAASAPLMANMANKEKGPSPSPTTSTTSAPTTISSVPSTSMPALATRKVASASTAVSALAARQQLLEQKIAEQKTLMSSLEKASAEEKKDIMTKLRKLSDEMTKLTSSSTSSEAETSKASVTNKVEQDKKEKERLDKELEMRKTADETSTTEELKAKLERLKAEVFVSLTDVIRTLTSPYLRLRVWVSMLRFLRPRRRLHTIGVGTVVDHSEEEGTPVAAHPERV